METKPYDEQQVRQWLSRIAFPVIAWAVLFALFAIVGASLPPESTLTSEAAPALLRPADGLASDGGVGRPSDSRDQEVDPAILAHQELDPVGAGHGAP